MKPNNGLRNLIVGLSALVVVVAVGLGLWWQYGQSPALADATGESFGAAIDHPLAKAQADDMVLGSADAKVTLIEYSSLSCPHCAKFQTDVLPKLKAEYIDTGKVKLVSRDFPLNKPALQASMLAHCLSPMQYFPVVDLLFRTQDKWLIEDSTGALAQVAANAGMDRAKFDACLADTTLSDKIVAQRQAGTDAFAVDSTPTFIANGIKLKGEQSYERMKALIDQLLAAQ